MKKLSEEIIHFFQAQGYVVVSSIGSDGLVHNSCKGLVKIKPSGEIYLLDLYKERTYNNLNANPSISITAVEEHRFSGYCLKGRAKIIKGEEIRPDIIKAWEDRITGRLTQRLLKNIREEKGHPRHPEVLLPQPEYMIAMEVEEVIDLTPHHLK